MDNAQALSLFTVKMLRFHLAELRTIVYQTSEGLEYLSESLRTKCELIDVHPKLPPLATKNSFYEVQFSWSYWQVKDDSNTFLKCTIN